MTGEWRPTASRDTLAARAALNQRIRAFMAERGVLEVETPIMSGAANPDPHVEPMRGPGDRWLRTSPELPIKRLLAAGVGDCYELGRVFRAGESGRRHHPEFTMLEWYRIGWAWRALAEEVLALVKHAGDGAFDRWTERWVTYDDAVHEATGLSPAESKLAEWERWGKTHADGAVGLDLRQWLDLAFAIAVEPGFDDGSITVVYDYPADQAALAMRSPEDSGCALRFEVFLGSQELANGFQELTDADEQRQRFEDDNAERRRHGAATLPIDRHFIAALESGLPPCSGVALGVDRLLMACIGADHIDAVLAFPADRA